MNKKLLKQLQARNEKRLGELRNTIESGEVREADLPAVQDEIDQLVEELQGIKDQLAEEDPDSDDENRSDDSADGRMHQRMKTKPETTRTIRKIVPG